MKSFRYLYIVVLTLLLSVSGLSAQLSQSFEIPCEDSSLDKFSNKELWNRGNTAYANGNYIEAERMYDVILCRGAHSAELYYNLGNVHYKRGEEGLALLFYYRAQRLAPSDSDIRHNIEVVRAATKDNIEHMPRLFVVEWSEWIGSQLSCMEWSVLSLVLLFVALALFLLYLLAEALPIRRIGLTSSLVVALLFIVATRYALYQRAEILDPSEAVVMSQSISVTSSPSKGSTELFIIHEGTKVEVLTKHDAWSEIKIDDGKRGWVESNHIELI